MTIECDFSPHARDDRAMRRSQRRSTGNLRQPLRSRQPVQRLPACSSSPSRRSSLPSLTLPSSLPSLTLPIDSGFDRQKLLHSSLNLSFKLPTRKRFEESTTVPQHWWATSNGIAADQKAPVVSEENWASNVLAELAAPPSRSESSRSAPRACILKPPAQSWQQRLKLTDGFQECALQEILDITEVEKWQNLGKQSLAELLPMRVKQTFKLFGTYEVPRELVKDMLTHLGFHAVREDIVEKEVARILKFSTFNIDELIQLADSYAAWELAAFRSAFEKASSATGGQLHHQDIADVMIQCGIMPLRRVIVHALTQIDMDNLNFLDFAKFIKIIAIYRLHEGFTSNQISKLHRVFHDLAEVSSSGVRAPKLKATQLLDALLQVFGPHCADQARQLIDRYPKYESDTYLLFRDFLVVARRLHEIEKGELHHQFRALDQNCDGRIALEDVSTGLQKCGYTVFSTVASELAEDAGYSADRQFNFDDYIDIVQAARRRECFRRSELEELVSIFNKFDSDGSDTIDTFELRKIFRHLGHAVSLRQVHGLVRSVDINGDGVLNFQELLRFMRLHREQELKAARDAFEQTKARRSGDMHSNDLKSALLMLGQKPTNTILEGILESKGKPSKFNFEGFVDILDQCRRACAVESHKRAEWSDKEFEFICQRFGKYSMEAHGAIAKGQLLWVLMDLGVKICTNEDRDKYLGRVDEARACALSAGVPEEDAGPPGASTMTVWVLAHLFRLLAQKDEDEEEDREMVAREETGFSHMEVAEFNEIFVGMIEKEDGHSTEATESSAASARAMAVRRHSLPSLDTAPPVQQLAARPQTRQGTQESGTPVSRKRLDEDSPILRALLDKPKENPQVSVSSLRQLLASFGLRLSLQQYQELKSRTLEITSRSGAARGCVDFADFLRLMKWMLDSNFADINGRAQQVADESSKTLRRPRIAVLAVKSALYWSRIRRPTVF